MKHSLELCIAASVLFASCASQRCAAPLQPISASGATAQDAAVVYEAGEREAAASSFQEIWAYLLDGREETLSPDLPVTDVGYFGATVNTYGSLTGVPDASKLAGFGGRVHMVVTCDSRSLTHFVLMEESDTRRSLIAELIEASAPYDGLQIDFELVPARDGDAFYSFLSELSAEMKRQGKLFTIALPARTRTISDDVYDYSRIAPVVDRLLVMAYDEHWSGSAPGPIASLDWCERVAAYAQEHVPADKLIMGLPFYGRTWGDENTFRAFQFAGISRIIREQGVSHIARENEIPTFTYEIPITVSVYFEDVHSLAVRLNAYERMGVRHAGFWCLGQEDPRIWEMISVVP